MTKELEAELTSMRTQDLVEIAEDYTMAMDMAFLGSKGISSGEVDYLGEVEAELERRGTGPDMKKVGRQLGEAAK